jgi:hypothetical protein
MNGRTRGVLLLLVAGLLLGALGPAGASYDKLYRFRNCTGQDQVGVYVVLNALEIIGAQYTLAPPSGFNPWGAATPAIKTINGVQCTTLTWDADPDVSVPGDCTEAGIVKIGWNTTDHSCRLRGLNWGHDTSGPAIVDPIELGDVPGGGMLVRQGAQYVWTFTNDTANALHLDDVEFGTFEQERLSLDALADLADVGIVGTRISRLSQRPGFGGQPNDLRPVRDALAAGAKAYANGNGAAARRAWRQAAAGLDAVIQRPGHSEAWKGETQRLRGLLARTPPREARPGKMPNALAAGASCDITIPANTVQPGDALVLHGCLRDAGGRVVLDWVDQVDVP